jgi:uncharacterized membrane protein HdeD (DUF308 family)
VATAWFTRDPAVLQRRGSPLLLWGLIVVAFGASILLWPRLTGVVFVTLAGIALLAVGLVFLYGGWLLRGVEGHPWLVELWPGFALVALGILGIALPDLVSTVSIVVLGALAVVVGIGDSVGAIRLANTVKWWWLRALRGALLVAVGLWIVLTPVSGLMALGWIIGLWAIAVGVVSITIGLLASRM